MLLKRALVVGWVFASINAACAGPGDRSAFDSPSADGAATANATEPGPPSAGSGDEFSPTPTPAPEPVSQTIDEVFGHSKTTLYRLDPQTKGVTVVGDFKDCEPVIDIAITEDSVIYAASHETLYTVDKLSAQCTQVGKGSYPNSLSFVPKGTLDPNAEVLVGYEDGNYVSIDTKTGARKQLGKLGGEFISSGDIVSVNGGKTFLTVKGGSCSTVDCLVEVDPKTGKMMRNWGPIEHKKVFGLSFWGGSVYGFDDSGKVFEVVFGTSKVVTKSIPIPNAPTDLAFWGAGSSTSVPLAPTPK